MPPSAHCASSWPATPLGGDAASRKIRSNIKQGSRSPRCYFIAPCSESVGTALRKLKAAPLAGSIDLVFQQVAKFERFYEEQPRWGERTGDSSVICGCVDSRCGKDFGNMYFI